MEFPYCCPLVIRNVFIALDVWTNDNTMVGWPHKNPLFTIHSGCSQYGNNKTNTNEYNEPEYITRQY